MTGSYEPLSSAGVTSSGGGAAVVVGAVVVGAVVVVDGAARSSLLLLALLLLLLLLLLLWLAAGVAGCRAACTGGGLRFESLEQHRMKLSAERRGGSRVSRALDDSARTTTATRDNHSHSTVGINK